MKKKYFIIVLFVFVLSFFAGYSIEYIMLRNNDPTYTLANHISNTNFINFLLPIYFAIIHSALVIWILRGRHKKQQTKNTP